MNDLFARFTHAMQIALGMVFFSALLALSGCGGGSGSQGGVFAGPQTLGLSLSVARSTLPSPPPNFLGTLALSDHYNPLYTTVITANVLRANGQPLSSGEDRSLTWSIEAGDNEVGALYPSAPREDEDFYEVDFNGDGDTDDSGVLIGDGGTNVSDIIAVLPPDSDGVTVANEKYVKAYYAYPEIVSGGISRIVVQANRPGTIVVRATVTDPDHGASSTASIPVTISSSASTGQPAVITTDLNNPIVYVSGQGKNDVAKLTILLFDPAQQRVPNPAGNNLRVEILNPELGAILIAGAQRGSAVTLPTINGLAEVAIQAGATAGVLRLRVTSDTDNNIDNGVQSAVIDEVTMTISDGRISSITLTSPYVQGILNGDAAIALAAGESLANGVFTRVITAVASDSLGNPVPGAEIRFGLIDSPVSDLPGADGQVGPFLFQGTDGNPLEGGDRFDTRANLFGVRLGDRLVLRPDARGPDASLAGSSFITTYLNNNSVLVQPNFAANLDATGQVRNSGFALPWVIGRPQFGSIGNTATTNSQGIATTFMTYPLSRAGGRVLIVAEAADNRAASTALDATYAANELKTYNLSLNPISMPANTTNSITLCVRDSNNVPATSVTVIANLAEGSGVAALNDPEARTRVVVNEGNPVVTGANGCAVFEVEAAGQQPSDEDAPILLEFSVQNVTVEPVTFTIGSPGGGSVSSITREGGVVTVTMVDDIGNPLVGVNVQFTATATNNGKPATCGTGESSGVTAFIQPGTAFAVTDANGVASATFTSAGDTGGNCSVGTPPVTTNYAPDSFSVTAAAAGATGQNQIQFTP